MVQGFAFILESALLGVGLAMDAFSVSLANGLNEPNMKPLRMSGIAGVFAGFQALMPMIGWICVHTIVSKFTKLQAYVPIAALVLLLFIGGKMIYEGIKNRNSGIEKPAVGFGALMLQGVATSLDALSVGLTLGDRTIPEAVLSAGIIGAVTFGICVLGVKLGKRLGLKLAGKASVFGGVILILIGLEIFITGVF